MRQAPGAILSCKSERYARVCSNLLDVLVPPLDGARDQRKSAFNLGDADKIRPLKASPSMRAFIVAIIVFGLTFGISILVLFRYGMSDNQTLPPSTVAENTLKVGTLIALVVAASHWLLPQPGW